MPFSKSVSGFFKRNLSDILPNSVCLPVVITNALAFPLITCEPIKSALVLFAKAATATTTAIFFSTGKVSPVKAASSIKSSLLSNNKQSAGITSPADKTMMSPGTTFSTGNSISFSSLTMRHFICTIFNSSATALAAPFSCQKPSELLTKIINNIINASEKSPKPIDSKAAAISNMVMGFLNCTKKSIKNEERDWALKVLAPYFFNLAFTSLFESPLSVLETYFNASDVVRLQNFSNELFMVGFCIYNKICLKIHFVFKMCE